MARLYFEQFLIGRQQVASRQWYRDLPALCDEIFAAGMRSALMFCQGTEE